MGVGAWVRHLLGRPSVRRRGAADSSGHSHRESGSARRDAETERSADGPGKWSGGQRDLEMAWLEACEAGRLDIPRNVRDSGAWDEYWRQHLRVGALDQGFNDMMSSAPDLPALLSRRGARTILCAGNGLSLEGLSLALLGFQVTALDIASIPATVLARSFGDRDHPLRAIPGFQPRDDGTICFSGEGVIDAVPLPLLHVSADFPLRGGGSLSFATGDLMDPHVCPGPFDVVVERRTLQLFADRDRPEALERLVSRLAPRGTFVSHQHSGRWKPGEPRTHYAEAWLTARGFALFRDSSGGEDQGPDRLAYLFFSTG
jgi:hypothetical protein